MTTITQVIDALPTAPDPATMDPPTFSATAAAYVLAQKAMVPQINTANSQLNTVAGEVNANAATASAAAATATTAASSATTAANATQWASGTYATGVCVWSPITYLTYRRTSTSPGASSVDPSAAPTLWVALTQIPAWVRKSGTYTAASGEFIKASTTGGAWSLTFPPSPANDDKIEIQDVDGTFGTNNLTILANGKTIMGFTTSFICDLSNLHLSFIYDSTTGDWRF